MKKQGPHKEILEKIRFSRDFDSLATYADSNEWKKMTRDERELLALLFVMEGEQYLAEGNSHVLKSFQLADEIASDSSEVMSRQALAFSKQKQNSFCLSAACKVYEKIAAMKPESFDAVHGWANALVSLGLCTHEMTPLQEALRKFSDGEKLIDHEGNENRASFFRDWGGGWQALGSLSGEACDYRQSVNTYHRASELGQNDFSFWNDYGRSLVKLSFLINKPALLIEGVELFWKVVKLEPGFYEGWENIGTSLCALYQIYPQEAYFILAHQSFDRASKLDPQQTGLWLQWGKLLATQGKMTKDLESLRESCKKFEIADICEPNHHRIFSSWSEALLLIGSWTEDLFSLYKSRNHVIKSLEIQPDCSASWAIYGRCLTELGKYFNNEEYYLQAIDKFRYGLKQDSQSHHLWYGLAMAVFAVGQLRGDRGFFEESERCFIKVIECGGHALPEAWNDWGLVMIRLSYMTDEKRYVEQALKKFEQALRLWNEVHSPEQIDPEWVYNYGSALELLGDYTDDISRYEQAAQVLNEVLEIDPSFHLVFLNLATAYSCLGDLTTDLDYFYESLKNFETYLSIDPEDDFAWGECGVTLISLAVLVKDPSRPDDAYRIFCDAENKLMQAATLGNNIALYHLACLYSLVGNIDSSIHYLERADECMVLPCLEDFMQDQWLERVRETPEFCRFLDDFQQKGV